MSRKMIGILALLFSSFLFAVPASAVDLPLCPAPDGSFHFTFVAEKKIVFEGGDTAKVIDGNLLVTSATGFVRVGKNTTINGTVIANEIRFTDNNTDKVLGGCIANTIVGTPAPGSAASCVPHGPNGDFTAYLGAHAGCVPATFAALCPAAACPASNTADPLTVAMGKTLTLPNAQFPSGSCIGALTLKKGAKLNLDGEFTFKSVRMFPGSQLIGPAGRATVNVNGQFITDAGAFITNINLNSASALGAVVAIFNNGILSNVEVHAPFGRCHPHTGTQLKECSEMCCKVLDIEPISASAECSAPLEVCACPQGSKFELPPQDPLPNQSPADIRARNCVPCAPGDNPQNGFPTCP
jgi:hypothetical protein